MSKRLIGAVSAGLAAVVAVAAPALAGDSDDEMARQLAGMDRVHEQMPSGGADMAPMHDQMMRDPDMARMHERMIGSDRGSR